MTLLKVAPDKVYMLAEERIRFPVSADVPPELVPLVVAGDLQKGIDNLERFKGWKRIEVVPSRQLWPENKVCCELMRQPPGSTITLRFKPSDFQGDPDDATNFKETSDNESRLAIEGIIDWVAIVHFWQPAIHINLDEEREEHQAMTPKNGFATWESMPPDAWTALREKYEHKWQ